MFTYLTDFVCTFNWGGGCWKCPTESTGCPAGIIRCPNDRWRHAPSESQMKHWWGRGIGGIQTASFGFSSCNSSFTSFMLWGTVMHVAVNMVGARRWCGVIIMGHRHQWRHQLGVSWRRTPFTFILHDDRLLYPALFFEFRRYHYLIYIIIFSIE